MGAEFGEQRGQSSHDRTHAQSFAVRDPASLVLGATAAQVIGGLVTQMSPLVIGGLIAGLSVSGPHCASQSGRPSEALAMVVNRRLGGTTCAALADAAA